MERYRKILVAVDGSESSRNAFRQACRIVHHDKSWITAITVIPPYQDQFQTLSIREKVSKALKDDGERILANIQTIAKEEDVYIKFRLEEGSPVDCILDIAEENFFDLVVTGRRGMSRTDKSLIGTVTGRIIGHSACDVLVVPRDTTVKWDTLLVPTDGSRYSEGSTGKAIGLAKVYGAKLKVISIVDVTDEFQAQAPDAVESLVNQARQHVEAVGSRAEEKGVHADVFVREGESYRVITNMAKKQAADMIIMGSHGRTGVKRIFMGSVTEKVIGHAPCPVLVVKTYEP
ncbi:MAG: universal stress protein [Nitrospirae bacterium]|nr:universal stress protein [Nitrospirota bacterium]